MESTTIRPIAAADDPAIAELIRTVMPEFGADGPGFAIHDPEVAAMTEAYGGPRSKYFVIDDGGRVVGGGGYAPLVGAEPSVCELRKMYFYPELRGRGWGTRLLLHILDQARADGFSTCYLETLAGMDRAAQLYRAFGFEVLEGPMGATGHFGCNRWMAKAL